MTRNAEASLQAAIVRYVRTVAPDVEIGSIPNGAHLSKSQAALLAWTGVLAGAPDLFLVLPGGGVAWWELKTDTGRLSPIQNALHLRWAAKGHPVIIIRSIDDARDELRRLGILTREAA